MAKNVPPSSSSTTIPPTSDDEKSHTFRKRRLSLSRHNIANDCSDSSTLAHGDSANASSMASAAAAAAAAFAHLEEDDEENENGNGNDNKEDGDGPPVPIVETTTTDLLGTTTSTTDTVATEDSEQKAQTFRKRRLSLTLKAPKEEGKNLASATDGEGDEIDQEVEKANANDKSAAVTAATGAEQPVKRQRRASDASSTSLASYHTGDGLRVRTLHAGEIVNNRCPPSPVPDFSSWAAGNAGSSGGGNDTNSASNNHQPQQPHVLYRMSRPSSMSLLQQQSENDENSNISSQVPQPKWKKRIVRKHDEDERKLPFPRDIVGTYSCHGVEPVYDSDYDPIEEEQEEEEEWTEDISGGAGGGVTSTTNSGKPFAASFKAATAASTEPKPTTAAKINQDRGGVAFPYGNCAKTALFAAYDGHGQGGELVSQFALHEIQSRLEKRPEFQTDLEKAFKDTFLQVDEALQQEPLIEPLYAGTTACVALLRENKLTVANAGDSRAVIARRISAPQGGDDDNGNDDAAAVVQYEAIDLTIDQNPDLPEERSRIESMGGFVSPPPEPGLSARVWLDEGFSQIGLAMARSIGDHAVAKVGVIAEPVVSHHDVLPQDEFLIIATDGVWEFLTSEAAVEIVGANLSRGATKATQALIEAAAARWHDEEGDYRDDITALVVRLSELWKESRSNKSRQEQQTQAATTTKTTDIVES